jgi:alginate O-acetyltransferase complex protein AlgI
LSAHPKYGIDGAAGEPLNFNSELFLFYFVPVWAAAYASCPERYRNFVALTASLFFYAWGAPQFILVVLASAALDWIVGRALVDPLWESRRKILLFAGISMNVAILLIAKYANFVVENISAALVAFGGSPIAWTAIALPIGVSFIVFEKISYLVDIWRGVGKPTRTFRDYLLYVFLFPKMIAGPIVRYHTIANQLENRTVTLDDWKAGFMRFIVGLSKKVLIADTVAPYANTVFGASGQGLDTPSAWLGLICFTLQIYFDFSGYSDMAIGLCRMMGIRILENFDTPYISQSFTEFWRRWHISLSTWIRDYLYIPLGGNRHGEARTYANLWICFLVSGLWHGANWTFLFWGAYHGTMLVLERLFLLNMLRRLPGVVSMTITLVLIMLGWVFFRTQSLGEAGQFFTALAGLSDGKPIAPPEKRVVAAIVVGVILSLAPAFISLDRLSQVIARRAVEPFVLLACFGLLILSLSQLIADEFVAFLYFRF